MTATGMQGDAWRDEGGDYLFHYTEARNVEEIADTEIFEVGGGANFGPGLYATDLAPEDASPDEIRAICFGGDAAANALNGVLVLLADDPSTPFEEIEDEIRIYRVPADEVGDLIPIESILVGVGSRLPGGPWEIYTWP
jgi:hypothetical protein